MEGAIGKMRMAYKMETSEETIQAFTDAANAFERIAGVEEKEWLPAYYVAYCQLNLAMQYMEKDSDKIKAHNDLAQAAIDKAKEIAPEESEVHALQGYIYTARIWENPMIKGASYSPLVYQACEKSISLNPDNPRPYFLKGQNTFYTPEFYGGGPAAAKPSLEKASKLFETFEKESALHPDWGSYYCNKLLEQANQ